MDNHEQNVHHRMIFVKDIYLTCGEHYERQMLHVVAVADRQSRNRSNKSRFSSFSSPQDSDHVAEKKTPPSSCLMLNYSPPTPQCLLFSLLAINRRTISQEIAGKLSEPATRVNRVSYMCIHIAMWSIRLGLFFFLSFPSPPPGIYIYEALWRCFVSWRERKGNKKKTNSPGEHRTHFA